MDTLALTLRIRVVNWFSYMRFTSPPGSSREISHRKIRKSGHQRRTVARHTLKLPQMHGGAHPSDGLGGLDEAPGDVHELSTRAQRDSRQQVTLVLRGVCAEHFL